jgi:hypothetical protein
MSDQRTPSLRVRRRVPTNGARRTCERGSPAHGRHAQTETRAHANTPWCTHTTPQQRPPWTPRCVGVQRLEVLVAVILARERRALAHAEEGGCTELAAALATLPLGLLEIVADAVAALGHADA